MEREKEKKVVFSKEFEKSLVQISDYGFETFGELAAFSFLDEIYHQTLNLNKRYLIYPENRVLLTSSKKYGNIIIGAYLILYRINREHIEVLIMFHSSISPKKIKSYRKIKA